MPTTAAKAANPKLETIKARLINTIDLAFEKVVANLDEPKSIRCPRTRNRWKDVLRHSWKRSQHLTCVKKTELGKDEMDLALALFIVGGALAIGAAVTAPVAFAIALAGILAGLTGSFFRMISDDFATVLDTLALDGPVLSETIFDRTLTADIGDYSGNYKAAVQWIAK
jgi:hypothetical protein